MRENRKQQLESKRMNCFIEINRKNSSKYMYRIKLNINNKMFFL